MDFHKSLFLVCRTRSTHRLLTLKVFLLATLGTQFSVTHMEAGRASVIIILELVTAVASALWIGGERMSATEMLGGALILTAAVIEARRAA